MVLDPVQTLVKDHLQAVDDLLIRSLHSEASIINDLGHYIVHSGGKRLRPLTTLLMARACGYEGLDHIKLAAVIELIHTATLLHDDVVDYSSLRRGKKTANKVWGNEAAVLVGDFLYSKAFQLLVSVGNLKVMRVLADATNKMAEGEALQLLERHNPDTTEGNYLNVIQCKTAKLFEAAAQIGAILAGASAELEQAAAQYGLHLGIAFQLMDDVLDYQKSSTIIGKTPGNDLLQGKVTLPLIYILQKGSNKKIQLVQEAIRSGEKEHLLTIQNMLESSGAFEYTKQYAKSEIDKAQKTLAKFKPSAYQKAAFKFAEFAVNREH